MRWTPGLRFLLLSHCVQHPILFCSVCVCELLRHFQGFRALFSWVLPVPALVHAPVWFGDRSCVPVTGGFQLLKWYPLYIYLFLILLPVSVPCEQVILEGNVYDLEAFSKVHPGGPGKQRKQSH